LQKSQVLELKTALENRHVIITGASGGIGVELTKAFLAEKAKVSAVYNTSKRTLELISKNFPDKMSLLKADVRKENEVKSLFEQAISNYGRIDVLIANAGIWSSEDVLVSEMNLERWQNTLTTNLTGAFLCAKYFFKNLVQHPEDTASLILIGSTAGVFGEAMHSDYASSKAALHGLMMSLKNEIVHIAPKGRVNLVNPGWTLTPRVKERLENQIMKKVLQTIPLRKIASPKDIANMVVYLASDRLAGHISGQSFTVSGGMEGRVLFSQEEIDPTAGIPTD
jgi:NAD(P)-dependent dehydrogenase (short-subunit alcohol dehydrogenase family)